MNRTDEDKLLQAVPDAVWNHLIDHPHQVFEAVKIARDVGLSLQMAVVLVNRCREALGQE